MTAQPQTAKKRPPYFYTEVNVDISPSDLEEAGWVYVGEKGDGEVAPTANVLDVVREWHDETHNIPWRWCQDEPCHSLNREQDPA